MLRSLLTKELRLQRTNLFFAAAVGLVWLLMLGFAFFPNHPLGVRYFTSGDLAQWVHFLFVLPCLYGLIPMMAGASAIAEERRLSTLDWQLAQPSRRWKQWTVKAAVAVLIALASAVFATLTDAILVAVLHAHKAHSTWTTEIIGPSMVWLRGLWPGIYSLPAVALGAFASSLVCDAYRALLLALALAFGVHWVSTFIDPGSLSSALWGGLFPARFLHPTIHYLMAAALAGIILVVAGISFRLERIRVRRLSVQLLCLILGILATTWITLHVEYRIPVDEAAFAHTSEGKGLTLLFMQDSNGHRRSEIQGEKIRWFNSQHETRLFRLPDTNRVLVDMQMYGDLLRATSGEMPDIQQIRRALGKVHSSFALVSQGGIPHRIFELNPQSGRVGQNPNLIGTLFSVSTVKPCFSVWAVFGKNLGVCVESWPWLRSDFKFDPRQSLTAPDRFRGEDSLFSFSRPATNPAKMESGVLFNPVPESLYPFGGKTNLWLYRLYRQIPWTKGGQFGGMIYSLVRPVAGSSGEYRIIDSGDDTVRYSVSPDGRWYLRDPGVVMGPGEVFVKEIGGSRQYFLQDTYGWIGQVGLHDHPTTGESRVVFRGPRLSFQYQRQSDEYGQKRVETDLDVAGEILPESPDGRYLALPRFHMIQDENKTQLMASVLDLVTGKETLLASMERPGIVQHWSQQDPYSSPPICKWSKGGVLGTLMANKLYLFQSPPGGGVLTQLGVVPVHAIGPSDFAFWSDTVMLLWNGETIWRLDLKKSAVQMAATPVTNPTQP